MAGVPEILVDNGQTIGLHIQPQLLTIFAQATRLGRLVGFETPAKYALDFSIGERLQEDVAFFDPDSGSLQGGLHHAFLNSSSIEFKA
jgi:hypothetical protein